MPNLMPGLLGGAVGGKEQEEVFKQPFKEVSPDPSTQSVDQTTQQSPTVETSNPENIGTKETISIKDLGGYIQQGQKRGQEPAMVVAELRKRGFQIEGQDQIIRDKAKSDFESQKELSMGGIGPEEDKEKSFWRKASEFIVESGVIGGQFEDVKQTGAEVIGGAVGQVPESIMNTAQFIMNASATPQFIDIAKTKFDEAGVDLPEGFDGNLLKNLGQEAKKEIQDAMVNDPEGTPAKVGELATKIGLAIAGTKGAGALVSAAGIPGVASTAVGSTKIPQTVANLAQQYPKMASLLANPVMQNVASGVGEGVAGAGAFSVVERGEVPTIEEVLIGGATGGILKGALGKTARQASRKETLKAMLGERESVKNLKNAFSQGKLSLGKQSKVKDFLFGTQKGQIIPSDQVDRASDIILETIKKPSSDPAKLFTQIKSAGTSIAKKLTPKLKAVKVSGAEDDLLKITQSFEDDLLQNKAVSDFLVGKEKKAIASLTDEILNSNNVDDLWKARIKFDTMTPSTVKNATSESARDLLIRQEHWKSTRNAINGLMDDIVKGQGDDTLRASFKDMSSLYKVQDNMMDRVAEFAKGGKGILSKSNLLKGAVGLAGVGGARSLLD